MGFHFRSLHREPASAAILTAHIRAAAADGAAGRSFQTPRQTPFRSRISAQEDAYIAWADARESFIQRRIAMAKDALQMVALDRAIDAQPHAFSEFPGHCPSPSPAGDEAATPFPLSGVAASEGYF